jgi:TPP-dependent pyruvate/acetoin dehydrogenase alpha subunit
MSKKTTLKKFSLSKEQALDLLQQMWEIRMFEDKVYELLGRDLIKGASHLYAGGGCGGYLRLTG